MQYETYVPNIEKNVIIRHMKLISIVSTDEMRDWINWNKCYIEFIESARQPLQFKRPKNTTHTVIVSNELHFVCKGFIWTRRLLQRELQEWKRTCRRWKKESKIYFRVFRCMAHDLHSQTHTHARARRAHENSAFIKEMILNCRENLSISQP